MTQIGTGNPGFGTLHQGLGTGRDAQVSVKLLQKIHGESPVIGPPALTARPVSATVSAGQARFGSGQRPARDGADPPHADPRLTGPRPTFARTPLEKMQSDRFHGVSDRENAAQPQDNTDPTPRQETSETDEAVAPAGSEQTAADQPNFGAIQHAREGFAASVSGEKPQPTFDTLK